MLQSALPDPAALKVQPSQIRTDLVDRLWLDLLLIAVFAVPLSMTRAWVTGWLPVYTLHVLLGLGAVGMVTLSRTLSLKFKAVLCVATLWALGLSGMYVLGAASPAFVWLLVSAVVARALFSPRLGLVVAVAAALVVSLVTYGPAGGLLTPIDDATPYSDQASAWAELLIAGALLVSTVLRAIKALSQSAAAAAEQRTRQWIDGLPMGVFVLGADYRVHYANRRATDTLGKWFVPNMHVADLLNNVGGFKKDTYIPYPVGELPAVRALAGEESVVEDMEIVRDGQRRALRITGSPVYDEQGQVSYGLAAIEDITEHTQIEAELLASRTHAEATALSKGQLVANMSQEIRAPVNAILGLLDLLQNTTLTPQQKDYLQKTGGAARSLLGLLNDFSDLSRVDSGKLALDLQPIRLDAFMGRLSSMMSGYIGAKSVEVLFDIDPALPAVLLGDSLRLQQVLANLCSNAVKFTDAGEVVVRVHLTQLEDRLAAVEFAVRDTGIGIAPDDQPHLFRGFLQSDAATRRRFGGTGLGLAISQKLVALMGGELQFDSELGSGSTFYFSLTFPVVADAVDDTQAVERTATERRKTLIVDDNRVATELMLKLAQTCGLAAQSARSGREALALIRAQALEKGVPFEVIFLDVQMPGLDGWETAGQIRQISKDTGTPEPKIIMLTTHGREVLAKRTREELAQINGLLIKPVTASMLLTAMDDVEPAGFGIRKGARTTRSQRRLRGMRLLLVEDSLLDQQIAEELLKSEGAKVSLATNGLLGVAAVATANEPFDAVLMDVQMPVMDGYDATRAIREQLGFTSLPIIAMSANTMPADRNACLAAGMTEHIGKPFGLSQVISVLVHHTGLAPQGKKPSGQIGKTQQA